MAVQCTNCGTPLPKDDARFCTKCGTLVPTHAANANEGAVTKSSPFPVEENRSSKPEKPELKEQKAQQTPSRPRGREMPNTWKNQAVSKPPKPVTAEKQKGKPVAISSSQPRKDDAHAVEKLASKESTSTIVAAEKSTPELRVKVWDVDEQPSQSEISDKKVAQPAEKPEAERSEVDQSRPPVAAMKAEPAEVVKDIPGEKALTRTETPAPRKPVVVPSRPAAKSVGMIPPRPQRPQPPAEVVERKDRPGAPELHKDEPVHRQDLRDDLADQPTSEIPIPIEEKPSDEKVSMEDRPEEIIAQETRPIVLPNVTLMDEQVRESRSDLETVREPQKEERPSIVPEIVRTSTPQPERDREVAAQEDKRIDATATAPAAPTVEPMRQPYQREPATAIPRQGQWGSEAVVARKKPKTIWIVAVVLVFFLLASSVWIVVAKPFSVADVTTPTMAYQSSNAGFSMQYPHDWTIKNDDSGTHFMDSTGTDSVTVSAQNEGQDVGQVLQKQTVKFGMTSVKTEKAITFGGASWQQVRGGLQKDGAIYTIAIFATEHNGKVITFVQTAPQVTYNDEEQINFSSMRSSFHF